MEHEYIIAHADKSVLKISGLEVKGLNTKQLEKILGDKLHTFVRVIGVTGNNIESIVLTEGITVTELTKLSCSEKIVPVDYNSIPDKPISDCAMERWMKRG